MDSIESGLEDAKSCVLRSSRREMRTDLTEAGAIMFEVLIVGGSAGQG